MADGLLITDTDVLVDWLRGAEPGRGAVDRWLRTGRLRIASVTAFELRLGADFLARRPSFEVLFERRVLPLDLNAALEAGAVHAALQGEGRGIGVRDSLVAGTCLRFRLPLATRNRRHFERVPGLALVPIG